MTCLWVPIWQSSTVVLNLTQSRDTTGRQLFTILVLVNFFCSFHFAHCLTLSFKSPRFFLPWFFHPVHFFPSAALSFLPLLYPFIFPHLLWAEKFWQSTRELNSHCLPPTFFHLCPLSSCSWHQVVSIYISNGKEDNLPDCAVPPV